MEDVPHSNSNSFEMKLPKAHPDPERTPQHLLASEEAAAPKGTLEWAERADWPVEQKVCLLGSRPSQPDDLTKNSLETLDARALVLHFGIDDYHESNRLRGSELRDLKWSLGPSIAADLGRLVGFGHFQDFEERVARPVFSLLRDGKSENREVEERFDWRWAPSCFEQQEGWS